VTSVGWDSFKVAFEQEFGQQPQEKLKRLKKVVRLWIMLTIQLLGVDATSNDMVSAFELADFTDTYGVEASYSRILMRGNFYTCHVDLAVGVSPFGTTEGLVELGKCTTNSV
jgi:hypothetical protein